MLLRELLAVFEQKKRREFAERLLESGNMATGRQRVRVSLARCINCWRTSPHALRLRVPRHLQKTDTSDAMAARRNPHGQGESPCSQLQAWTLLGGVGGPNHLCMIYGTRSAMHTHAQLRMQVVVRMFELKSTASALQHVHLLLISMSTRL